MRAVVGLALASLGLACEPDAKPRETLSSGRASPQASHPQSSAEARTERPSGCPSTPSVCSSSGWCVDHPRPAANELRAVWGSGPKAVFAVGDSGTALRFDGEWHAEVGLTEEPLTGVWGSGPSDVYAVGRTGQILHYDGTRWSNVPDVPSGSLNAIGGSGPSDLWAVGAEGHALHWDGARWTASTIGKDRLDALWASGPNDVYVTSESGLLRYDGHAWTEVKSHAARGPSVVAGSGPDHVLFGLGGVIEHWDGKTWTKRPVPWTGVVTGLWAGDARNAFAAAGDSVLRFEGGGWIKQSTAPALLDTSAMPQIHALWGSAVNDVHAVGSFGMIHHFDGSTWSLEGQGRSAVTLETLSSVWGSSSEDLYVGGTNLLHYDGCEWRIVLRDLHVRAIWGTGRDQVLVLGKGGQIHAFDGQRWTVQRPPSDTDELTSVWGRAADDVYAVGARGATLHWDGKGWQTLPAPPMPLDTLMSVAGTAEAIYATDRVGAVYRLNGNVWERSPWTQVGDRLRTVGQELFLWNRTGAVFQLTPDGWSELVGGALAGTNGFAGTGSGEHYTVGVAGRMQRWDGGRWNDEATGFGRALWAVWASEHEAVAVGDGGVILRKRLR